MKQSKRKGPQQPGEVAAPWPGPTLQPQRSGDTRVPRPGAVPRCLLLLRPSSSFIKEGGHGVSTVNKLVLACLVLPTSSKATSSLATCLLASFLLHIHCESWL